MDNTYTITGSKGKYSFMARNRLNDNRGAMNGGIFRGIDLDTQREVAIKWIDEETAKNPKNIVRIRNVVHTAIKHKAVLEYIDFCEEEDQDGAIHYFVIMEFLEGENIADWFNAYVKEQGAPPSEPIVLDMARSVLSGLKAIHDAGVVHRDIDPSNWMRCSDGTYKIIDLDIAYIAGSGEKLIQGAFAGKRDYVSPQQFDGKESPSPDWDLYALGVSMFELLTSLRPYRYSDKDKSVAEYAIRNVSLPHNDRISPWLFKVLLKATAKESKDRFQSAEEFLAALEPNDRPVLPWRRILAWGTGIVAICGAGILVYKLMGSIIGSPPNVYSEVVAPPAVQVEKKSPPQTQEPPKPPSARFELKCSNNCIAPCTVTLNSTSTSLSKNAKLTWVSNDGKQAEGKEASFPFDRPGTYRITLTVTNDDGLTSSQPATVIVTKPIASIPPEEKLVPPTPKQLEVSKDLIDYIKEKGGEYIYFERVDGGRGLRIYYKLNGLQESCDSLDDGGDGVNKKDRMNGKIDPSEFNCL